MGLARVAWQRAANRCFVQEDAKRAPKLACCSSDSPSVKQSDAGPRNAAGSQDISNTVFLPFSLNPSCSNLSPRSNSKWWLQRQSSYCHQKGLMNEHLSFPECNVGTGRTEDNSGALARNDDVSCVVNPTPAAKSSPNHHYENVATGIEKDFVEVKAKDGVGCEVSKGSTELYLSSGPSWIGSERSIPWWRSADKEEIALLVSQRSQGHIENCDLPSPQKMHIQKKLGENVDCFNAGGAFGTLLDNKFGFRNNQNSDNDSVHTPSNPNPPLNHSILAEGHLLYTARESRSLPTQERFLETNKSTNDTTQAQLLKALHHSQTRAREAERVAQQACAEKEHVVKLLITQASQLFAYRQWFNLLQLENMHLQLSGTKSTSPSLTFPVKSPWASQRSRKTRKRWPKTPSGKRAKRQYPWHDLGKYAAVLALGLGLVGAGFLLRWNVEWMLPTW